MGDPPINDPQVKLGKSENPNRTQGTTPAAHGSEDVAHDVVLQHRRRNWENIWRQVQFFQPEPASLRSVLLMGRTMPQIG
jgi:hypothetical protein